MLNNLQLFLLLCFFNINSWIFGNSSALRVQQQHPTWDQTCNL
uniref:Uncharacterized protein n=1 Tax=Anguilla anguilla TaxID=7936 RepID=A0A0E9S8B1_ANGAN